MTGWFQNKRRIAALEAEVAALSAERAQTDLAAELQREQARATAAMGEIAQRLLTLQERVLAQDNRSAALERSVADVRRRIDEQVMAQTGRENEKAVLIDDMRASIREQGEQVRLLRSSLESTERAFRLARGDADRTLGLLAARLLPEVEGAVHVASGVPLS